MTSQVTPEKVKNLLSSFLAHSNKSSENLARSSSSSSKENGSKTTTPRISSISPKSTKSSLRSHRKFLERLDTFSTVTWFGKPLDISPINCARYGWENVDIDMLKCVGCNAFLSGTLPSKTDSQAYEASLSKLKINLLASHDKFCALAVHPCPEHFCHVPVDDPVSLLDSFTQRATALNNLADRLPYIDESDLSSLNYDVGQGGAYCKRHLLPNSDILPQAVALAFSGWTSSPTSKDVLTCSMCRRQIGLWNFVSSSPLALNQETSKDSDSDEEQNDGQPKAKRRKISPSKKRAFNPVDEHHRWCPWVQHVPLPALSLPSSSSGSAASSSELPEQSQQPQSVPAFILALRNIAPGLMDNNTGLASAMKTSPMVEGLRCFRRVMKTWSSPKTQTTVSPES